MIMKTQANIISTVLVILLLVAPLFSAVPASAKTAISATEGLQLASGLDDYGEQLGQVTLITGDMVSVMIAPDGERRFSVSPARPDRLGQHFLTFQQGGDMYVIPDDIKALSMPTLAHRLIVSPSARIKEVDPRAVVEETLKSVPVPGARVRV